MLLGEARVHAEDFGGKERGLVAAGAGADFEDDVLFVVGILGNQQDLDFFFDGCGARLERGDLFLGHGAQVGVGLGQHGACFDEALLHLLQFAILFDGLFDLAKRLGGLLIFFVVVQHFGQRELRLQVVVALLHLFQTIEHCDLLPRRRRAAAAGDLFENWSGKGRRTV